MDSEDFAAETPGEQACIRNCQDKTYAAFDMFMTMRHIQMAQDTSMDKAAIVDFEIEHSNDTSG